MQVTSAAVGDATRGFCVRGTFALGDLLTDVPANPELAVFVIWMLVVPTEFGRPSRARWKFRQ